MRIAHYKFCEPRNLGCEYKKILANGEKLEQLIPCEA